MLGKNITKNVLGYLLLLIIILNFSVVRIAASSSAISLLFPQNAIIVDNKAMPIVGTVSDLNLRGISILINGEPRKLMKVVDGKFIGILNLDPGLNEIKIKGEEKDIGDIIFSVFYKNSGNSVTANIEKDFTDFSSYEPNLNAERNYKLALAMIESGHTKKAIEYLKTVVIADPNYNEASLLLKKINNEEKDEKISLMNQATTKSQEKVNVLEVKNIKDTNPGINVPPAIVIATPQDGQESYDEQILVAGLVADDKAIDRIEIWLNGNKKDALDRNILIEKQEVEKQSSKKKNFKVNVKLETGENILKIVAYDDENNKSEQEIKIKRLKEDSQIWAAVIGIGAYQKVRTLQYTVPDAEGFYKYLTENLQVDKKNVFKLIDNEATVGNIRKILGTELSKKTKSRDTVIIYFAGHGATEQDSNSPDGDSLEKYLLPCDTDPNDLYSTAIPMSEIEKIFSRIKSERLILIADACYSGATGGRTIYSNKRATISDKFLERLSKGKGRIILTASSTNELSQEKEELGHGVFTYYLLEGLKGAADYDGDKMISVDEVYRYITKTVPDATGQQQNPMKKGEVEGQVFIGRVE